MRDLVIQEIKRNIDWHNGQFSWQDDYIPVKYPDFDEECDEYLLKVYEEQLRSGPIG